MITCWPPKPIHTSLKYVFTSILYWIFLPFSDVSYIWAPVHIILNYMYYSISNLLEAIVVLWFCSSLFISKVVLFWASSFPLSISQCSWGTKQALLLGGRRPSIIYLVRTNYRPPIFLAIPVTVGILQSGIRPEVVKKQGRFIRCVFPPLVYKALVLVLRTKYKHILSQWPYKPFQWNAGNSYSTSETVWGICYWLYI